jgi:hypothetical protein
MRKKYQSLLALTAGAALLMAVTSPAYAGSAKSGSSNVEKLIQEQQRQLDQQASEIAFLKEQLNALLGTTEKNSKALTAKVDREEIGKLDGSQMVSSSNPNVNVSLYGQVNRALLWADNSDSSKVYFVDNSNSSTRMGIQAIVTATNDLSIGSKIEYELLSNPSNEVNQLDQRTTAELNLRKADVWLTSKAAGRLSIGQGSTASDGTSEIDLSGTSVVTGSSVDDMAGGQFWFDSAVPGFTIDADSSTVGESFDDMDGLSRRDRIRYDSPSFSGFSLATSAMEDEGYDIAGRYSRKFGDSRIGAAIAWAKSGNLKGYDDQVNGSISYLHSSGFNATLAGGQQNFDIPGKDDPIYWYGKLGYRADLFPQGNTAFSIDYGRWDDLVENNDEAQSFSVAFVQNIKSWGTEFYLAYRLYSLDRDDTDFKNVNSVMTGARLKF